MKRRTLYTQILHNNYDWYCDSVNVEIRDMRWNRCDERVQLPSGIVTDSPSKSRPIGIFVSDGDDLVWRCYVENIYKAEKIGKKLHRDISFRSLVSLGFTRL